MTVLLRVAAMIGYLGHRVDRIIGRLLGFLPFRVPGAVLVASLLIALAWSSAIATNEAIAARPRPLSTSVADLVAEERNAWVEVSGLLSGPHLDNSIYASDDVRYLRVLDEPHDHQVIHGEVLVEPGWRRQTIVPLTRGDGVTRWFYVLRDPDSTADALVVRSARNAEAIRTRSVRVTSAGTVDGLPLLIEVGDAAQADAEAGVDDVRDDQPTTIRATLHDADEVECSGGSACVDGVAWRYRVSDAASPASVAWLESPHAPDALPITLAGVTTTDAVKMRTVLAAEPMRAALAGLRHPTATVLADGVGPILPSASYVVPAVLGGLAGLLILSAAIGYPIFRQERRTQVTPSSRPVVGELIDTELTGTFASLRGGRAPSAAGARVGWLSSAELTRQAWHLHRDVAEVHDDRPHLAILALESNLAIMLEPLRAGLRAVPGSVATTTGIRPALRLTGPGTRAILSFESADDRGRTLHELDPAIDPPQSGSIPARPPRARLVERAWVRPLTAGVLLTAAVAMAVAGLGGLVSGDAPPIGVALAIVGAAFVLALAAGMLRRHPLAAELLPSVALVAIVGGALLAVASAGCGTWLIPTFEGCSALEPWRLVPPVTVAVAFAISMLTASSLARTRSG